MKCRGVKVKKKPRLNYLNFLKKIVVEILSGKWLSGIGGTRSLKRLKKWEVSF